MGALFAFREGELLRATVAIGPVLDAGDAKAWKELWPGLGLAWNLPRVLRDADLGGGAPGEAWLPAPRSTEHMRFFRELARSLAACRIGLEETRWHVCFPELSDDGAGFAVSESEEYEALGQQLFTSGAMPAGLELLDERPDVTTNWVSAKSVMRLWDLERTERLLQTAGSHMAKAGLPLGTDFLQIRALLGVGSQNGWALYLWDPGS
jgi:hypothetical protein